MQASYFQHRRRVGVIACLGLIVTYAVGVSSLRIPRLQQMPTISQIQKQPDESRFVSPTRSLFTYRRDDSTPDSMTLIHINVRHVSQAAISQNLFGNFIEHLGGVVYRGLWADALINPNLEAAGTPPTDDTSKAPPGWSTNSLAPWRRSTKEQSGYFSPGYVTLFHPYPQSAESGMLSQTVYLPARREREYVGSLYARLVREKEDSGVSISQGQIQIELTRPGDQDRPLAKMIVTVTSARWNRQNFHLTLPGGALKKGEAAQFTVRHHSGGSIDVDQVELFPADNVNGVDVDVLHKAQEWHIPILRWPGGNFASGYHWQDGVGRREQRPTRKNAAWGGIEPNHFGTDEFLAFSQRVGAQPQITVNAGDGTPEDAADWVRYCNAPTTDKYGKLRAQNGHAKPYHVRLWEVGNELYGNWQIGHTVPQENAARFVRFRDALLQADSGIQLIATGKGDEFSPTGMQKNAAWNDALLNASVAGGGRAPDYVSIHPLVPLPSSLSRLPYDDQYESAMAHTTFLDRTLFPDLAERIRRIEGAGSRTRIAVTEWGLIVGGNRWQDGPNHDTLAGAVYNALCLNAMLRNSDWVTLANMTAFMHGGGIKKPGGVVIVDPQYWTQQMYAASNLHTPLETITTGPGNNVPSRGFLPAVSDVPDVDVFAALDKSGKKLVICAVNRHRSQPRPIRVDVEGFEANAASAKLLTAPAPQARNSIEAPDDVAPRELAVTHENGKWEAALPPHSFAIITLQRR